MEPGEMARLGAAATMYGEVEPPRRLLVDVPEELRRRVADEIGDLEAVRLGQGASGKLPVVPGLHDAPEDGCPRLSVVVYPPSNRDDGRSADAIRAGSKLHTTPEEDGRPDLDASRVKGVKLEDWLPASTARSSDNTAWSREPLYKLVAGEESPEKAARRATGSAAPFGDTLLDKNRAAAVVQITGAEAVLPTRSSSPCAVEVCVDQATGAKTAGAKAAGAGTEHDGGGSLSAVVGILVASSAVTGIAAGAVSPAVAFGFFVVLLGGLSLAMASVHG